MRLQSASKATRVTTNRGAKTPGVDNVIWRTDKQKLQAAFHLKRHGYRPRPLRQHYIPKPNGKLRPLSIWASPKRRSCVNSTRCCAVGPTTTATEWPNGPLASWNTTFTTNFGAGPPDATPTSPKPGMEAAQILLRDGQSWGVQREGPSGHGREPRTQTLLDGQHKNRTPYQSQRGRKPL